MASCSFTVRNRDRLSRTNDISENAEKVIENYINWLNKNEEVTKKNTELARYYFIYKISESINLAELYSRFKEDEEQYKKSLYIHVDFQNDDIEIWDSSGIVSFHLNALMTNISYILYRVIGEKILNKQYMNTNYYINNVTRSRHSRSKWVYWDVPLIPL